MEAKRVPVRNGHILSRLLMLLIPFLLDWVRDKERTKFAFEGMCWAKSHIPLVVWKAGESNSNLVESVHADVNREGISCTLVGGVMKGQRFDILKEKTLQVCSELFI